MTRRARPLVLRALVLLAVVVAVNIGAYATGAEHDFSEARRFTLSPQTRALIKAVPSSLKITAFINASGGGARDARFLLARFRELNHRVTYSVIDPDERPGQARRFGVTKYATVVLQYKGRRGDAPSVNELDLATAILRLVRNRTLTLCVLTGHGEASLDDESGSGLSKLDVLFQQNAYEIRTLDLTKEHTVPKECTTVVEAGPRVALLPSEVDALVAYTKAAGRLMVLASPLSTADPNPLLEPWGLNFLGGVVLDQARNEGLDPSNIIVQDFPSVSPVTEGVPSVQLPVSGAINVTDNPRDGLSVTPLAMSSDRSFAESNPDNEQTFDQGDIPGPIVVAAAADDSRVDATGDTRIPGENGQRIVRSRVFVTGSAEWISNQLLDNLGNRRLMVNALNWLSQEEQVLAVTGDVPGTRSLAFTPERQTRTLILTVGLVPGLVIALGVLQAVFVRRRHR